MNGSRHLAIVGPTACGKSAVALAVAVATPGAEIVSVDSMQVYRGMDIGTAKPSTEDRRLVRHHLVDVADPWDEWSVVRFRDAVLAAVDDVEGRGGRAVLVGGTGLYFRAVVDGLEFPEEDRDARASLEIEAEERGSAALHAELERLDPEAAARIEPTNARRVVRALEVIRSTGRRFSSFGPGLDAYSEPVLDVDIVGLRRPRAEIRRRISARLEVMRRAGLVDEVRALASADRVLSRTAAQAIGYREVLAHLAGEMGEDEAFTEAATRTWRFARRQLKWFERDPRVRWLELDPPGMNEDDAAASILSAWAPCHASA